MLLLAVPLVMLWSCGGAPSEVAAPAVPATLSAPEAGTVEVRSRARPRGSLFVGQELYQRKCAGCHGSVGAEGQPLVELARANPGAVAAVIREGRGAMPAFQNRLPEALVEDVVAFLRAGGTAQGAE